VIVLLGQACGSRSQKPRPPHLIRKPQALSEGVPRIADEYSVRGQPLSVRHTLILSSSLDKACPHPPDPKSRNCSRPASNRRIHNVRTYHYYAVLASTYPGSRGSGAPYIRRLGDDWMGSTICDLGVALQAERRRNNDCSHRAGSEGMERPDWRLLRCPERPLNQSHRHQVCS